MSAKSKGFTLLELLIALAVFSILSIMAYSGLQMVLDSKGHTENQADRLISLQRAFTFIGRDVEQTIGRSIRDTFGDVKPAMVGSPFGTVPLELTRTGWRNPAHLLRTNMERVMYRYEDETITRLSLSMLDQPNIIEPLERELLSEVKELRFRYMDEKLQWQDEWPPQYAEDKDASKLPRAVEVTINYVGVGEVKRLFRVPPGEYRVRDKSKDKAGNNTSGNGNSSNNGNNSGNGNNSNSGNNSNNSNNNGNENSGNAEGQGDDTSSNGEGQ